jgi:hypothetical protein
MAITPNTTFTSGQILTAQQQNNLPFGVMGYASRTAGNITLTTTQTDLTGMSITFTAIAGRLYKCSWIATGQNTSGAVSWAAIYLMNGATQLEWNISTSQSLSYWTLSASFVVSGLSAGTQTLKLQGASQVTSNTLFATTGGLPLQFVIEDIGHE